MNTQSRRTLARALGGGLALLLSGSAGARLEEQRKTKSKFRTVTKTFTNASPIAIPNGSNGTAFPYPSPMFVSGFKRGKVLDVNVTLKGFGHTFPSHTQMMLVAPNDRHAIIMADVGFNFPVSDLTLTLDDEASAPLPVNGQLGSGRFRPTNLLDGVGDNFPAPAPATSPNVKLATFDGVNPNGTWRLFVVDADPSFNSGSISTGWSLTIKARVRK